VPFTQNHILVQYGGTIYTNEIWSNSLRLGFTDPHVSTYIEDYVAANYVNAATAVGNVFSNYTYASTDTKLTYFKMNAVGTDGHYSSSSVTNRFDYTAPGKPGGGSAGSGAPQLAVAVTLLTGAVRGLANKGRIYVPALNATAAGGSMSSTIADTFTAGTKLIIDALNAMPNDSLLGTPKVSVMSNVRNGVTRRVIGIRVGVVVDTQRRRRSALKESYRATVPITS